MISCEVLRRGPGGWPVLLLYADRTGLALLLEPLERWLAAAREGKLEPGEDFHFGSFPGLPGRLDYRQLEPTSEPVPVFSFRVLGADVSTPVEVGADLAVGLMYLHLNGGADLFLDHTALEWFAAQIRGLLEAQQPLYSAVVLRSRVAGGTQLRPQSPVPPSGLPGLSDPITVHELRLVLVNV